VFGKRALEKALSITLAENADLKQRLRDSDIERAKLLDRIMALTNPGALREVNRPSLSKGDWETPPTPSTEPQSTKKERLHRFPGNEVMVLPTRHPTPPTPFPPPPEKVS
jgi:hypothetical protein